VHQQTLLPTSYDEHRPDAVADARPMLGLQQLNLELKKHVFGPAQEAQQHQTVLHALHITKRSESLAGANILISTKHPVTRC
jgi:hypothetical protein